MYAGILRPKSDADVPGCRTRIVPTEVYITVLISYFQTRFVTLPLNFRKPIQKKFQK